MRGMGKEPTDAQSSGEVRVLLVDDDPGFADVASRLLEQRSAGMTVDTVSSARAALDRLAEADVDAVVSDYAMPGMDGLELLDAVRAERPDLPFVLFTGKGSEDVASEALARGADDYLQKGIGTDMGEVLANRIGNAVERTRSKAALQQREARFRTLIEHSPATISVLAPDGTYTYVSPSVRDMFGYDPAELVGTDAFAKVHPEDREAVWEAFSAVVQQPDEMRTAECRYKAADGEWRWVQARGKNRLDDPAVEGIVVNTQDVTERKERERELEERRAKIESLHDVAVRMDECDTEQAVCDLTAEAAEGILEFDICVVDIEEDGLLPTRAGVGLPPGGTPTMSVEEGIAGKTYRTGESFLVDDVGTVAEAKPQGAYRSALSVPIGDHGVFQAGARKEGAFDETDLQLAELLVAHTAGALDRVAREQALRTERDRFAALFEMISEPVVHVEFEESEETDGEAVIKNTNSAFEATFGYPAGAVVGESVNDVLVPDDRLAEAEAIDGRAQTGEAIDREVRRLAADGPRDFLFRSAPIDEAGDEHFGIYIDVSEQKERERQLQRQNERLDEFASVVSHDLRNPLNVAAGHVDLARAECDSDHLDTVVRALDRMDALVADVLTLARQGQRVEEPVAVDLAAVAEEAWTTIAPDGDLHLELDDATVLADPSRLQQVFENLFRNAAEHAGPGATVRVGLLADRRGFYVADDGPGIPETDRERVFDHGYSTSDEGTGFGLSIVQSIVEAHGWAIAVTEGRDGGARFEITGVDPD